MFEPQVGERCVLVVDHDDAIVAAVSEALEDHGYAVLVAFSGEHAWTTLRMHAPIPDVLLLDASMPDGDGSTLRARMQSDPALADIPVVTMPSAAAASSAVKPLQFDALLETMRDALGRRGRGAPAARVADF